MKRLDSGGSNTCPLYLTRLLWSSIQINFVNYSIKGNHYTNRRCQYFIGTCSNKNNLRGFPGGLVVKNTPASVGNTGSTPGVGSSHMPGSNSARDPQLLSQHPRVLTPQLLKPTCLEAELHSKGGPTVRSLLAPTRESPHAAMNRAWPKLNKQIFLKKSEYRKQNDLS